MEDLVALKEENTVSDQVHEAVLLFRAGLLSLVPTFQKSEVKWDVLENYDDFFSLSESLFNLITIEKIKKIADENSLKLREFANYGYYHKDYSKKSYIEAIFKDNDKEYFVFNFFGSVNKPFDSVCCNKIDSHGKSLQSTVRLPFDSVKFRLKV